MILLFSTQRGYKSYSSFTTRRCDRQTANGSKTLAQPHKTTPNCYTNLEPLADGMSCARITVLSDRTNNHNHRPKPPQNPGVKIRFVCVFNFGDRKVLLIDPPATSIYTLKERNMSRNSQPVRRPFNGFIAHDRFMAKLQPLQFRNHKR